MSVLGQLGGRGAVLRGHGDEVMSSQIQGLGNQADRS